MNAPTVGKILVITAAIFLPVSLALILFSPSLSIFSSRSPINLSSVVHLIFCFDSLNGQKGQRYGVSGDCSNGGLAIGGFNSVLLVVKELPAELASKEPVRVDCSKRKGLFDYVESVLPSLLEYHYISITPAMSQRRDIHCMQKQLYVRLATMLFA